MPDDRIIPTPKNADLVTFKILSNGSQIDETINVLSIWVSKAVNKIPTAQITIADGEPSTESFGVSTSAVFVPGNEIEIKAGYHSDEKTIFKGIITRHTISARNDTGSKLVVTCKDKSIKMTAGRKNKYFTDMKDSEIIEQIIGNYGLDKEVEATTTKLKAMVQYSATDWDFVNMRADANGKLIFVDDGKVSVKAPDTSSSPALKLTYGATMLDFEAELDADHEPAAAKANTWDYSGQEILSADNGSVSYKEEGNISSADIAKIIGPESLLLSHSGKLPDTELKAWADSKMLKGKLSKIVGRVRFQGYGDIKPGNMVTLNGLGDRFNGNAFVTEILHQIGAGNWTTDIQFGSKPQKPLIQTDDKNEQPAAGLVPAISGLEIGVVTQLKEDPDGEDRILVKLPIVDPAAEGVWTRIATLDAGNKRGTVFRPEIGDEVVVGFFNGDPRCPVMLGMMNSSAKPSPIPAADENNEKGFVTRSEIKFVFNDDEKSVTLVTPAGKSLVLDDNDGSITILDELGNKIQMNSDGITMESAKDVIIKATGDAKIDGVNINAKASAQFKAEGSGGAEVSSSATAVLKGSLVQIN